jgi:hypothetical protein
VAGRARQQTWNNGVVVDQWVRIEKRKYPDRLRSTWEAVPLGADELGSWFFAPAGIRNTHLVSGVQLLVPGTWWVAWWWAEPKGWWCAADVATPAVNGDGFWSYDDLEIDVWGNELGFQGVVDEDEFERVRLSLPYPDDIVTAALTSRDQIVALMQARQEPFGIAGWNKLRAALANIATPSI